MIRILWLGLTLIVSLSVASCGIGGGSESPVGGQVETVVPADGEGQGGWFGLDDSGVLPLASRLILGTLKLEGTENAVDLEEAAELLPLWKAYRTLVQDTTTAARELEGLIEQIQETMTPEQLAAIESMELSAEDVRDLVEELGLGSGFRREGSGEDEPRFEGPGFGPGSGFREGMRIEGSPPGGIPGGVGPEGELSPEARATLVADRGGRMMGARAGAVLIEPLIEMLEAKLNPEGGS